MPDIKGKKEADNHLTIKKRSIKDDPKSHDRRRAVKIILGGMSVLTGAHIIPEKWTKPLIDYVSLPVHAQTSFIPPTSSIDCNIQVKPNHYIDSENIRFWVRGSIEPAVGGVPIKINATAVGGGGSSTSVTTTTVSDGTYSRTAVLRNGPGITWIYAFSATPDVSTECSAPVPPRPNTTPT